MKQVVKLTLTKSDPSVDLDVMQDAILQQVIISVLEIVCILIFQFIYIVFV